MASAPRPRRRRDRHRFSAARRRPAGARRPRRSVGDPRARRPSLVADFDRQAGIEPAARRPRSRRATAIATAIAPRRAPSACGRLGGAQLAIEPGDGGTARLARSSLPSAQPLADFDGHGRRAPPARCCVRATCCSTETGPRAIFNPNPVVSPGQLLGSQGQATTSTTRCVDLAAGPGDARRASPTPKGCLRGHLRRRHASTKKGKKVCEPSARLGTGLNAL